MLGEQSAGFFLIVRVGQILDVDVVENASELTAVSWLVLDGKSGLVILRVIQAVSCRSRLLEADETISTRRVIWVEGDLERLYVSIFGELVLEPLGVVIVVFGDLCHEHVVLHEASLVASEKLVVVGKGTTILSVDLEVAELLACLLEAFVVGDDNDSGVEWAIYVASELRLAIKDNASLLLDQSSDCVRGDVILGQIVQVKVVLLLSGVVNHGHLG